MTNFRFPFWQVLLFWCSLGSVAYCFGQGFSHRFGPHWLWLLGACAFVLTSWYSFWKWGQGAGKFAAREAFQAQAKVLEETQRRADRLEADIQRLAEVRIALSRPTSDILSLSLPDLRKQLAQKEWELQKLQIAHERLLEESQSKTMNS